MTYGTSGPFLRAVSGPGRAEVEIRAAFCGFDEASNGIVVFDFGHEIQNQEIDLLDFVVSEFDTLRDGHFGRDVSAHAKSVFVSFVNDRGHLARA
jgi:hypothetical protein